jgi:hypothetical protein
MVSVVVEIVYQSYSAVTSLSRQNMFQVLGTNQCELISSVKMKFSEDKRLGVISWVLSLESYTVFLQYLLII